MHLADQPKSWSDFVCETVLLCLCKAQQICPFLHFLAKSACCNVKAVRCCAAMGLFCQVLHQCKVVLVVVRVLCEKQTQ
jgi:hypothetical protein